MSLTDIFRTFYPNAEEYTFFSRAHGTFSRIDIPWVTNYRKIEIISSFFSSCNAMTLDIKYKKRKKMYKTQTHGD